MADEEQQNQFGEDRGTRGVTGLRLFDLQAICTTLIYCRIRPEDDVLGPTPREYYMQQAYEEADQLLAKIAENEPGVDDEEALIRAEDDDQGDSGAAPATPDPQPVSVGGKSGGGFYEDDLPF